MIKSVVSHSEMDTERLGASLARGFFPGAFLALWGGLGAGKTAFARGAGEALGVKDITSPTFTIIQEHPEGKLPLYHFDVYRLRSGEELYDTGYEDYLYADGVILMEWPENVVEALPDSRMDIYIEGSGEEARNIRFQPLDEKHAVLLQYLEDIC